MKTSKRILIIVGAVVILIAIIGAYKFSGDSDIYMQNNSGGVSPQIKAYDATYKINGQEVKLENGIATTESAPGSASKIVTKYFGNDLKGDFDKDGTEDSAFIVTQNTGGTGTFYYVTTLLNKRTGKVAVDAVLLGDRIAPQSIDTGANNTIVVNYADRNQGDSFTAPPSVGKTIVLKVDTEVDPVTNAPSAQFGEVAQNFEGEADPAIMTLSMKSWNWINTTYSDDKGVTPKVPGKFTLTLKTDKTFSATTDCNGVGGEYTVKGNQISFTKMMSTLMFCEGSQEADFSKMLAEVQNFLFTSKGELVLGLQMDSGSVFFR
jgi:heat shock protein HslJ